jgi:hypothetical protein
MGADERFLASMSSFVNLEILTSREYLAAVVAAEWLFAGVDSHVIDELVLRLEGSSKSRAVVPEAEVLAIWRFDHVLVDDVFDELGHGIPLEVAFGAVLDPVALEGPGAGVLDFDGWWSGADWWRMAAISRRSHVDEDLIGEFV